MTPTDAQISAALDALAPTSHSRADVKAALTAAAEVGKHSISADRISELQSLAKLIDIAIERCAQVAECWHSGGFRDGGAVAIAAAIRALKDKG